MERSKKCRKRKIASSQPIHGHIKQSLRSVTIIWKGTWLQRHWTLRRQTSTIRKLVNKRMPTNSISGLHLTLEGPLCRQNLRRLPRATEWRTLATNPLFRRPKTFQSIPTTWQSMAKAITEMPRLSKPNLPRRRGHQAKPADQITPS
jgi:hypothetical protein